MNRKDFIKWFEQNVGKANHHGDAFSTFRDEVNYEPLMYDEYSINEDTIEYSYEEWEWGSTNYITRIGTFEEFIEAKKNDNIKNFGREDN